MAAMLQPYMDLVSWAVRGVAAETD